MPFQHLIKKGYSRDQAKAIMAKEGHKMKHKSKKKRRGFASLG